MITAVNLTEYYPNRYLFSNLSFSLGKGLCVLEGKSGCGKTTLLRILSGLEKTTEGEARYSKEDFVFFCCGQEASLYGEFTLNQNLSLFKPDYVPDELRSVLEKLRFPFSDKKINQLSGGECQKAEIAFCLSKHADAYILDEPFASLDKEAKDNLVLILNKKSEPIWLFSLITIVRLQDFMSFRKSGLSRETWKRKKTAIFQSIIR